MSRRKRSSKVLEKAERRAASLRSINTALDLGNGLSIEAYFSMIEEMRSELASYNTALSGIDKTYSNVLELERKLGDFSELILLGVATRYGKSSDEYVMAGGARKVSRRRPLREVVDSSSS
ncbi:hypothetical protein IQ268_13180 [Oculatella sp. LEGE 06141]|uniref:hypothetical protein n=1 Tax=Oculatella sp. LEGE 06141 TaxID=1828648 RepID=UPI0018817A90|nr:hypothetical protein [Oculatella sp. LEGE 06141]MBE9179516.1 hypothetical protein [Oculatella sp. LEGE 06141]